MKTTNQITVIKMETPERYGDWHDKPLKWQVVGPATEIQKFSTKRDAKQYATLRRHMGQHEAIGVFSGGAL